MTKTHPLIVRITTGSHATKNISPREARGFNIKYWEVLMRFFPNIDDPKEVRIIWQSADERSSCVWGMLIEVIGAQPDHPSIKGNLKEVVRDLLPNGYNITVAFPTQPIPSPVN